MVRSLEKEKIDKVFDPEKAIDRAIEYYRKKGYSDSWIVSNKYFVKLFVVSPKSISVTIGKLKRLGYINVTYLRSDTLVMEKSITLTSMEELLNKFK